VTSPPVKRESAVPGHSDAGCAFSVRHLGAGSMARIADGSIPPTSK